MISVAVIVVLFLIVLALSFPGVIRSKRKGFIWFYIISFALSMTVVILNSMSIFVYGPSYWVMDIIDAMGLLPR